MSDTQALIRGSISGPPNFTLEPEKHQIMLQVGERQFNTSLQSLKKAPTLEKLVSPQWNQGSKDKLIFIDADGDVFEHILQHLRSGMFPVFYDRNKGHDYAMYAAVYQQADYWGADKLAEWIQTGMYLQMVKVTHTVSKDDDYQGGESLNTSQEIEYFPKWGTKEIYVCPRQIPSHKGSQGSCGRQCASARGTNPIRYEEEEVLKMVMVRKTTSIAPLPWPQA
ncbi:hypothetical protein MMC13_007750 [Lambiella insularis]|nr:hypothetical protein [Lambiella insularis]